MAAISGMNVYAACFLIPIVVAAYVIVGGLRSTFIADYVHTIILFLAIFIFGFLMYATSDLVGSPSRFYDLLVEASERSPIARNAGDGSYLAFKSVDGLVFAIDLFVAGFTTVWLDQAYWQRAIASRPETSVRAYILGGIAWYGKYIALLTYQSWVDACRHPFWICHRHGSWLRCSYRRPSLSDLSESTLCRAEQCRPVVTCNSDSPYGQRGCGADAYFVIHGRNVLDICRTHSGLELVNV